MLMRACDESLDKFFVCALTDCLAASMVYAKIGLFTAAEIGDVASVELALRDGVDVNWHNDKMETPLLYAIRGGQLEVVTVLLAAGALVNKAGQNGWSPLMCASSRGHAHIVQALLAAGADVNQTDDEGEAVLAMASREGHAHVVTLLVAAGADAKHRRRIDGSTALHEAVHGRCRQVFKVLVGAGANVDIGNRYQATPLGLASWLGYVDSVAALLEEGADPFIADKHGRTPIDRVDEMDHWTRKRTPHAFPTIKWLLWGEMAWRRRRAVVVCCAVRARCEVSWETFG